MIPGRLIRERSPIPTEPKKSFKSFIPSFIGFLRFQLQ